MRTFLVIISLFFAANCEAQSRLPKQLPSDLSISYSDSGGMLRAYKKITIEAGKLNFEELRGNQQKPEKWSAELAGDDIAGLYKVFVDNKFDTIRNDKRTEIVYDAGSETISISAGISVSFHVTSGKNSPLSGGNRFRYQAVARAIADLTAKYDSQRSKKSPTIDRTGGSDRYIQGKWRAAGQTGSHAWFMDWTFDNGRFKQVGYPPIQQEGKYRVVKLSSGKLTIQLYDQKGTFGEEDSTIVILIDTEANQLSIDNIKPFYRTTS